ncbi:hypothetical protein [Dactylosporangium roseum]
MSRIAPRRTDIGIMQVILVKGLVKLILVRAGYDVLWQERDTTLAQWIRLLRPSGRLVFIEGRWTTGAGLSAAEASALLRRHGRRAELRLLNDHALWGQTITDERYLLLSRQG